MSIPETGAIQRDIGDAQHALDSHQLGRWLRGSGHLSGGAATAAGGLTIEVPSDAEVLLDGETVPVDEFDNTADVTSSGTMPRWSIISVESDGSVTATDGEPRELVGDDSEPARVRDPAPPLDYPGVCYAAVFVPAGASGVTDDEILDRRLGASIRLASVTLGEVLTLEPAAEPDTPATGEVALFNDTNDPSTTKAKHDDGSVVTITET